MRRLALSPSVRLPDARNLSPAHFFVRPAGRTLLEVKVLYTADMGKC